MWSETSTAPANTSPSAANWLLRTGTQYPGGAANWGTGSVETASNSTANVYLDGAGKLNIKAIRDGAGNWTSGRIETQRTDFAPQPGELLKFTAVLKQPDVANGLGYWPALPGHRRGVPRQLQQLAGRRRDRHHDRRQRAQPARPRRCTAAPRRTASCAEYNGRTSGLATCAGCQTGYHEYSQVIDRTKTDEEIRFYLDGRQTWVVRESQVGVAAWQAAVHHGFYLRLDLAIGGSLPNAIAGFTTPTAGHHLRRRAQRRLGHRVARPAGTTAAGDDRPGHPGRARARCGSPARRATGSSRSTARRTRSRA